MPYVNIALDSFGIIVVLIVLSSCLGELITKKSGSKHFLLLLTFIILSLVADIVSWIGEGNPNLSQMTLISNTAATCFCYLAIACFMGYLKDSIHSNSKAAIVMVLIFKALCVVFVGFVIGNIFGHYGYTVNDQGHYVHGANVAVSLVYLMFPVLSFVAILLTTLFAKKTSRINRVAFMVYTLFPMAGLIIDYTVHGFSLTYIGLVVSVLIIYTSIYLQKQKLIDEQRNALMLSQINPHFMYNTLTTIASMCEISPKQAKDLTVDFSSFLRKNLSTITAEELIPFNQEIEHVECYLKIEKARFGDRLKVLYSISCRDFRVPPLSIQTLVENAVKHGITKKAAGGTVKISTFDDSKNYYVEIIDDGAGFDIEANLADGREHLGINNVKNRLAGTCKGSLTVKSTVGIGTRVMLSIPKGKGKRK